ncbi:MAG: diacylglycerol kinase [Actinomycetota bacterium]|nr:diacylglycerol kinase [Actinomycetota bacterium]
MAAAPLRIIQWSTGHVGLHALRAILDNPSLELVGVWVHSEEKAGRDAGELAGRDPVGVLATNDVDALLDLHPDVVCYTATADLRPQEAVDDICRILRSGANVVSSSLVQLLHPPTADASLTTPLAAACQEGGTSCWFNGIDPGFANDLLPLVLTGTSQRIRSVRVLEVLNYATYDQPTVLFDTMGFGQALDAQPMLLIPGILEYAWGGAVNTIAAGLGLELDELKAVHERAAFDQPVEVAGRTIEPGTQAGLRFEVQGWAHGRAVVIVEHVTRVHDDVAPDWPAQVGQGGYRILVDGEPSIVCDVHAMGEDGDINSGGLIVTATRLLNAAAAVVAAPPGLLSALDLPLATGRGLVVTT